jgi:hypothetical protein
MTQRIGKAHACLLALGVALGSHGVLAQQAQPVSNLAAPQLEEAFWACDYLATTRGVDATPADTCGAVYARLKETKFRGDFGLLLTWWQDNKAAEHQKLISRGM